MQNNLDLLIIEKGNTIDFSKESNYTFEGIFTEFGVKNKNKRIYEKEQFLPHLKELQTIISQNKLLGELDHPKDFEVMLSRASHVIENLSLDESGNKIMGRIKLMDTAKGKDAKAIADAGVPLHISSRAAGSVNENGVVTVKKLFTYDLVADPGFANAELSQVAESLNISEDRAQEVMNLITESQSYNSDELVLINESLGIKEEDGIEVYQIVKKTEDAIKESTEEKKEDQLSKNSGDKVTVEQLTKWSNVFIKEMESFVNDKVGKAVAENKDKNSSESVEKIQEFLSNFSKEVNEKFSQFHQYTDYLSDGLNQIAEHNNHLAEGMNQLKEHNNYLVESLNLVKGYAEKGHMEIADLKTHNDHIVENSNNLVKFIEHVAEKANQGINYTESVSEGAKLLAEYAETIAKEVNMIKEGKVEKPAETTNESVIKVAKSYDFEEEYELYEYVLQSLVNGQKKQVVKLMQEIKDAGGEKAMMFHLKEIATKKELSELMKLYKQVESVKEEEKEGEKMDETLTTETSQYKDALSQKISEALENAKKEQEKDINNNNNGDNVKMFFELLPENYQKQFETLPEDKKQKLKEVSEGVNEKEKVTVLFESFISENKSLNWIDNMPEQFKAVWESLNKVEKAKVEMQAESYELDTQARIDWFWQTRNLVESKPNMIKKAVAQTLNENQSTLGYTINQDAIINAVKGIHK